MAMIEVSTEYGKAILPSKVLAEGIKRAERDSRNIPEKREKVNQTNSLKTRSTETI